MLKDKIIRDGEADCNHFWAQITGSDGSVYEKCIHCDRELKVAKK
jgi:hypothetical protein